VPVIIIGETRLAGFNPAKIDEALRGSGMSELEPVKLAGQSRQDVELRAQVREKSGTSCTRT